MGVKEEGKIAGANFFSTWRDEYVAVLEATRSTLMDVYSRHASFGQGAIEQTGRRLLGWNNLGVGADDDVIEIMVWPCPALGRDEVRFEFTALPHIWWRKQLRVMRDDDCLEELELTDEQRRKTSKVFRMGQDWPLKLQVRKLIAWPMMFKDVVSWPVPEYPGLGGCVLRMVYVAVRPNNC
eukprot:gnl/MRDRNA2_/MRDRNA2_69424_c0_seq1.p1 gnl/MRDRNA2_/MRDRNA2_69424_c0~~gnl/MRDRNA2_/MRDRNA2_69424_c0_seq1.p1  ORF type:complete len:181 (+),score=26.30 gnl/MRDRNA2_/MRDRNA2_69424_c0_seq1:372-914(+)